MDQVLILRKAFTSNLSLLLGLEPFKKFVWVGGGGGGDGGGVYTYFSVQLKA